jgi:large subunit ribosomal protein L19
MNEIIRKIEKSQIIRKGAVPFRVGDTVKVSLRIKEGEKERIQVYEGLVVGIQGGGAKLRFTVRKLSYGVGVEKTFFYQSPMIKDVKTVRSGKVRRAKLFYLRGKLNKKDTRIQENKRAIRVPGEEAQEQAPVAVAEAVPVEKPVEAAVEPKAEKKEKA